MANVRLSRTTFLAKGQISPLRKLGVADPAAGKFHSVEGKGLGGFVRSFIGDREGRARAEFHRGGGKERAGEGVFRLAGAKREDAERAEDEPGGHFAVVLVTGETAGGFVVILGENLVHPMVGAFGSAGLGKEVKRVVHGLV